VGPIVAPSNPRTIDVGVEQICTYARLKVPFSSATARLRVHETIRRKRIASMQKRTNSELDVATMVMLLDCGMSLKDIAECFKLEVKTVERLIVEHRRSPGSKQSA
jgi:DNA-binding NarL/FixJ family response regulator